MGKEMAQRKLGDRALVMSIPGPRLPLRDADVTVGPCEWEARSLPCPRTRNEMERGRPGIRSCDFA